MAGPTSRELLNGLLDAPIENDVWPFMACGDVTVCGVKGRLFRISFSGEHAYEIAVPAHYGDSLFRLLKDRAETLGGGAYGMEALNVLRIEKGFITHGEIDGRVTAFDIGMERMISSKKDCIGQTMANRAGLSDESREQLMGFKPVGAVKMLTGGAHLYEEGDEAVSVNSRGYLTSVAFSPTLGYFLAQGFVQGGSTRLGDRLRMVDQMRQIETIVEVCDLVFFDPKGERVRG